MILQNAVGDENMSKDIKMMVSGVTTAKDGSKVAYVYFSEGAKSAEIIIPDCKIIHNQGFSEQEIEEMNLYVRENLKTLKEEAVKINPLTALMK